MIKFFWKGMAISTLLCAFSTFGLLFAQAPQTATQANSREFYRESQMKYSQAYWELAKHELKIAEENKSSLSPGALERSRNNVKIAEEQLRIAALPVSETDTVPIRLRFAEVNAELARQEYLKAVAFHRENQFAFTDAQIERLRLKAEVAKQRLNVMSNPLHTMSLLDHMHWEIDRLNEDLITLQERLTELEKR